MSFTTVALVATIFCAAAVCAAPSSSISSKVDSLTALSLYGMIEDDMLCFSKAIGEIVKDTKFESDYKVVDEKMKYYSDRIRLCRKNAKTDQEEIECVLLESHTARDILYKFLDEVKSVSPEMYERALENIRKTCSN